ncbi:hypothetical protein PUN28_014203 [Cardiocondyla obscurior]|uniref:Uncharacterized protein n=1 Tax=Cardiocondyla obscurior TaxID=286306 RepID=A0AAW2F4V2_9HYME
MSSRLYRRKYAALTNDCATPAKVISSSTHGFFAESTEDFFKCRTGVFSAQKPDQLKLRGGGGPGRTSCFGGATYRVIERSR